MYAKTDNLVSSVTVAPTPGKPTIYSVSSGKGGVGKTSLTVNLAHALAWQGSRVLVVDGDLGLANIDVLLGLTVETTIRDVLERGEDPRSALVYLEPNLAILPATSGVPEMVNLGPQDRESLDELLRRLGQGFEYILIDTAAGIGHPVLWFNTMADHNLVIMTPDPTSLTDAYALMKVLSQRHRRQDFLVTVNQVLNDTEGQQVYMHLAGVAERFLRLSLTYLGAVPKAPEVIQGVRQRTPFLKAAPQGKASRAVYALTERLRQAAGPR